MAWCKLDDTFYDDPKFGQLADMLGIHVRHAQGLMAALWSWATRHAPDGDLRQLSRLGVERIVDWSGAEDQFVTACEMLQLLDSRAAGLVIHGYWKRAESHKSAIKQRNYRKGVTLRERNALRDSNVTVSSRVTAALRLEERRGEEREEREEREESPRTETAPRAKLAGARTKSAAPVGCIEELKGKYGHEYLATVKHEVQRGWIATYTVPIVAKELSKAATWLAAKGVKKKNFGAFLTNWLSNADTTLSTIHKSQLDDKRAPGVPSWEETERRLNERKLECERIRKANEGKPQGFSMVDLGTSLTPTR